MDLPARIGKYELQELLGGGMSRVYRARDTVIGRTVVVKVLSEQASKEPEAKARFLREAQLAGNLAHDNVINVYDFGEENGLPYMVMEYLRGEDLRTLIKDGRTGDLPWRLRTALQIARAIDYIHQHKIIHRDIKPENIQVTSAGVVKLMDFGIAKAENTQLTRPGFTLGTPFYMAPEQVRGQAVTGRADIYSFGVLLFELLTGVRPINGDTVERIFYEILYQPVDLKPLETAGVPPAVSELVAKCTAKDAEERPQTFAPVCSALERALRHLQRGAEPGLDATKSGTIPVPALAPATTTPSTPAPAAKRSTRWELLLAAAGAVMMLAAAWLYFLRPGSSGPSPVLDTPTGLMVLVPAGEFLSGPDKSQVTLHAFYIDKTEVTNAAWAHFCHEKLRRLPEDFQSDQPDYPIVDVSFTQAREFAAWAGKRLPTALEWEKAARGTDGRNYPWGNQRDLARANVRDNPSVTEPETMPANSMALGASPFLALHMLGNVWEFVDQRRVPTAGNLTAFAFLQPPVTESEPWYAIRGGAYDLPLIEDAISDSWPVPARHHAYNIGFRCAKDVR